MKKLSLTIATFLTINSSFANEFTANGARYAAQAGAMVANANDAFGLAVNPANLLTHTNEFKVFELAGNVLKNTAIEETENNMLGGYFAKGSVVFGIVFESSPGAETFTKFYANPTLGKETSQTSLAAGFGNILLDNESFTYGVGVVYTWINVSETNNKTAAKGDGFTGSAKVAYQSNFNLQESNVIFDFTLGAALSTEIKAETNQQAFSLRPQIARIGVSTRFSHYNSLIPWELSVTGEHLQFKSSQVSILNLTEHQKEMRMGSEWTLIQPFGLDGDFSIRAGVRTFDSDNNNKEFSSGLGYTIGSWSFDISSSKLRSSDSSRIYNLSISCTFGH